MTEDIKKYPVPKEISKLFKRSIGAEKCRDFAIKIGVNIKIALAFSEIMTNSTDTAWNLIYKLYPDLKKETIYFTYDEGGYVFIKE